MIDLSDIKEKQKAIYAKAALIRQAANAGRDLKPVIWSFDGKTYNRRFDGAIAAQSGTDYRYYVSNQYGWFYITYTPKGIYKASKTLLTGYSCKADGQKQDQPKENLKIFDGKKINAAKMCAGLDAALEKLLQEAYTLERAAEDLEVTLKQIKDTYDLLNSLTGSLPAAVLDICNLRRFYY